MEPFRIVYAGGFWYLVAGHEGALKKFLLDFIEGVAVTDQYFPAPPTELAVKLAAARTIWFDEEDPVKLTVEFDAEVADYIRRKQYFPAQEILEEREDGRIVVTFEVANEMDFFQQFARWMPYSRIVGPPDYRKFIREMARRAMELNAS